MSKLAFGTLAILALVVPACGDGERPAADRHTAAATAVPPALEETFTSPRYGYSVRHPAGWSALRAARPLASDEVISYASDSVDKLSEDPRGTGMPLLTVGADAVARGADLDDFVADTKRRIEERVGCRPRSEQSVTVAGETATRLSYPACATYDTVWTVLLHGTSGVHIVWWSEQGRAVADRPLYDAILGTFAFG